MQSWRRSKSTIPTHSRQGRREKIKVISNLASPEHPLPKQALYRLSPAPPWPYSNRFGSAKQELRASAVPEGFVLSES